ncbi:MAG: RHS repeat protein, partial [Caldilineaceae bacterium]|nr:RHS repeat protein [Caldilineaceae bacterium]
GAAGRLQSRTRNGKTVAYDYGTNGQVAAIDYWGRGAVEYGYDGAGQLTSLTPWAQPATSYGYRSSGLMASQSRANGVSTSYSYDSASRLTRLLHATGGGTLQDIQYVLDANGNRTQMSDSDGLTTYAYDALNRLTQVELPAMPTGPPSQNINYGLDAVG